MIYIKIKQLRELRNVSIDTIAKGMNTSISNYIAIECGEIDLKLSEIYKIAEIIGVDPREFFIGIDGLSY